MRTVLAALALVLGLGGTAVAAADRDGARQERRDDRGDRHDDRRANDRDHDKDRDRRDEGKVRITLTAPAAGTVVTAPATLVLTASVQSRQREHPVTQVEFHQGATLIGTATTAPYGVTWAHVPAGAYRLTARATTDKADRREEKGKNGKAKDVAVSAPVDIVVNAPPTVALTSPAPGAVQLAPASFTLTAGVSDSDGSIAKVEFYSGTTLIGTATGAPYSVTWANVPAGNYTLAALATDNLGGQTTSIPANVSVIANSAPAISLTSPAQNLSVKAPASIALSASAADPDNNLVKVEFFQGGTLIATVLNPPYAHVWTNVAQGTYPITAVATDAYGAQATSTPVTVTVTPAQASLFFIHPDHLGTPRMVTDSNNTVVWRNLPTTEPFGNTPPEEDPNATGSRFEMPLALPGQYRDRETNTHYNYFRDCYDSGTGRYCQSDPIGFAGGSLSLYTYANQNPLSNIDPLGLAIVDPNSRIGAGGGGGAEGLVIAGAALVNAIMNSSRQSTPASSPTSEQSEPNRSIWPPERQPGLWSCKARADCNDNIPGNCPDDPKHRFAFGGGSASDLGTARNIAKANATSNLQCQPKHVSCKCTGPKGEQYSGGC